MLYNLPREAEYFQRRVVAIMLSVIGCLLSIQGGIGSVIDSRLMYYRERAAGLYSPLQYYLSTLLVDVPVLVLQTIITGFAKLYFC